MRNDADDEVQLNHKKDVLEKDEPLYGYLSELTSQRLIKTHLPFQLMPRNITEVGAKVVYVARNPKDVIVSYFYLQTNPIFGFSGDFETYVQFFIDDLAPGGSPYWKHVLEGWNRRHDKNVHFMFYEDLLKNMDDSIKKLASFLEKPLNDEDLPKLKEHLKFDNFKKNPAITIVREGMSSNQEFIRRGKIGGNPEVTEQISKKVDKWIRENLINCDLKFPL